MRKRLWALAMASICCVACGGDDDVTSASTAGSTGGSSTSSTSGTGGAGGTGGASGMGGAGGVGSGTIEILARVDLPAEPHGAFTNSKTKKTYVACGDGLSDDVVAVVDLESMTKVAEIPTVGTSRDIAIDEQANRVYLTSTGGDPGIVLEVIDGATDTLLPPISGAASGDPMQVAVHPQGGTVYVGFQTFAGNDQLLVLDGTSQTVTKTIDMGSFVWGESDQDALTVDGTGKGYAFWSKQMVTIDVDGTITPLPNLADFGVTLRPFADAANAILVTRGSVSIVDPVELTLPAGSKPVSVLHVGDGVIVFGFDANGTPTSWFFAKFSNGKWGIYGKPTTWTVDPNKPGATFAAIESGDSIVDGMASVVLAGFAADDPDLSPPPPPAKALVIVKVTP